MRKLKLFDLFTIGGLSIGVGANAATPVEIEDFSILLHNITQQQVDEVCMKQTLLKLFDLDVSQKLAPMRVEIDAEHTLVKNFYSHRMIEANQISTGTKLLVAAEDKASELIVIRQDQYRLYELPEILRISNCLTSTKNP